MRRTSSGTTVKTTPISIRRGLSLYKQPCQTGRGSPNWYARVFMNIAGRSTHVRTTKTTDEREARRRAEEFWSECAIRRQFGDAGLPHCAERPMEVQYRFDRVVDA